MKSPFMTCALSILNVLMSPVRRIDPLFSRCAAHSLSAKTQRKYHNFEMSLQLKRRLVVMRMNLA